MALHTASIRSRAGRVFCTQAPANFASPMPELSVSGTSGDTNKHPLLLPTIFKDNRFPLEHQVKKRYHTPLQSKVAKLCSAGIPPLLGPPVSLGRCGQQPCAGPDVAPEPRGICHAWAATLGEIPQEGQSRSGWLQLAGSEFGARKGHGQGKSSDPSR